MTTPTVDGSPSGHGPTGEPLPEQIGRYRILERLGAGGMGTVYKARDPHLDRVVALKLPQLVGPREDLAKRIQRLQREARAAAQVWHPHVCPIYDVGEQDGQPYLVMAYVEGRSLEQRLLSQGRFESIAAAVTLIRQVLDALGAIHAHGITHRDLKPGNIMIDQAGRAILMDFGLARPEYDAEHLTSEGVLLGTPAYMAPEQAAGQSERVGPWTDLYSVGVVLYQLLTGRLPFEGPPLVVLSRIVHESPLLPSRLRPDLDADLEAVLLRALAKEPAERFASAREFAEDLETWSQNKCAATAPQALEPVGRAQPTTAPLWRAPFLARVRRLLKPRRDLLLAAAFFLAAMPCFVLGLIGMIGEIEQILMNSTPRVMNLLRGRDMDDLGNYWPLFLIGGVTLCVVGIRRLRSNRQGGSRARGRNGDGEREGDTQDWRA